MKHDPSTKDIVKYIGKQITVHQDLIVQCQQEMKRLPQEVEKHQQEIDQWETIRYGILDVSDRIRSSRRFPDGDPRAVVACTKAIRLAGGLTAVANAINRTPQYVYKWKVVPAMHSQKVAGLSGVPIHELRPDLFSAPIQDKPTDDATESSVITSDSETVELTYPEFAERRGIKPASAKKLAMKMKWPRRTGEDGFARVTVPVEYAKPTKPTKPD